MPQEVLEDYLGELRQVYTPKLTTCSTNNCNTFSNELSTFLTGQAIPVEKTAKAHMASPHCPLNVLRLLALLQEHITNCRQEVLSTPMGQMLAPMLTGEMINEGAVTLQPAMSGGLLVLRKDDCVFYRGGVPAGQRAAGRCATGSALADQGPAGCSGGCCQCCRSWQFRSCGSWAPAMLPGESISFMEGGQSLCTTQSAGVMMDHGLPSHQAQWDSSRTRKRRLPPALHRERPHCCSSRKEGRQQPCQCKGGV